MSYTGEVPASAIDLAGDLLESCVGQVTAGFLPGTVAVMLLGTVMVIISLFWNRLLALVEKMRRS